MYAKLSYSALVIITAVILDSTNGAGNSKKPGSDDTTTTQPVINNINNNNVTMAHHEPCKSLRNATDSVVFMIFRTLGCTLETGAVTIKDSVSSGVNYLKNNVSLFRHDAHNKHNNDVVTIDRVTSTDAITFRDSDDQDGDMDDEKPTTTEFSIDTRSLFNAPQSCPKDQRMGKDGNCRVIVT